ncbi:hypothetical protein SKAU_G00377780 [Synaphobranchus kaupii]|uniref:NXPE C-terminal domain-containing protein n=1 Tax=Synaphobranchus kaupii TaxID=118154 RepID=A0A9Q1ED37_SYNKA|nr:hypothetical protein SKAU_G00377780 [Synaphobranchus kaupii]
MDRKPHHQEEPYFVRWTYNYPKKTFFPFSQTAIMTPQPDQGLLPGKFRSNLLMKTLLLICTFAIVYYLYFLKTYNRTTLTVLLVPMYRAHVLPEHEPTEIPFGERPIEDVMRSLWDDLPTPGNFRSIQNCSSGRHSVVELEQPRAQYCVGDTLNVLVNTRDYRGTPKVYGGDLILARIHSPELQASASGEVTDLRNGSYRVRFHLFWPGNVQVAVILVHSSEAVQILRRISAHNYDKIIYTGTFYNGSKREESRCGVRLKTDKSLCEYGRKEDAEYYACFRPATLPCNTLRTMRSRYATIPNLRRDEYQLLSPLHTGIHMRNRFAPVNVSSCPAGPRRPTEKCVAGFDFMSPLPTGYFFKNRWSSSVCQNGNFFSADAISRCLKGKKLKIIGDSTARQWQERLTQTLKGLKYIPPYHRQYSGLAVDPQLNITVQWKMHAHPFINGYNVVKDECRYVSRELDTLAVGDLLVIGLGQHFRAFPLEIFTQRLINIRKAILRLQARDPQAFVVIKMENTREFGKQTVHLGDWYGYVQILALRKVFRDLKVVLVDAWDMTTAANTFAVHPDSMIVSNQISLALSHLCHDT